MLRSLINSNRFAKASELACAQTTLALILQNGTLIAHFAEVDFLSFHLDLSLREKAKQSGLLSIGWILRLATQNEGTVAVGANGASIRHPSNNSTSLRPLSRSLKTVRLERPSLRHSGLRSGIYSFLSLRRNSGVNNNCWRGKLQRRVLSDRSEFTSLDAEPCRLLVNGCVAAGFVKLLPPKVSPSGGLNRKFYKNIVNYLI